MTERGTRQRSAQGA